LSEKYDKVVLDRKDLKNKFDKLTSEVKKHAEMYNVVLSRKLETELEQLEQKEAQLHQLMQNSALEPKLVEEIKGKVKDSIENKNLTIKNLKYSLHHATKAYNDAIRVYEAKLVQFGIPAEELGFQPLQTITSTMPAGLVSS
jgi:growth arrest-specific protein 8